MDAKTWQAVIQKMRSSFKDQQFEAGLAFAIEQVSQQLIVYFPDAVQHSNELPDAPLVQ